MPRLNKGQIAVGIQNKMDQSKRSVNARIDALQRLQRSTERSPDEVANFINFDRLASWCEPQLGITPLSTKTLRKHLNNIYEDGLLGFRRDVSKFLKQGSLSDVAVSVGRKPKRLSTDQISADAAMEMTARYLDLLERLNRLAVTSESAAVELQGHSRRYSERGPKLRLVKK